MSTAPVPDMTTLMDMSIDQLRSLNDSVIRAIKAKRKIEAEIMRDALTVGDRVRVITANLRPRDRKRMEGKTLIVEEIKVSKALCQDEDGIVWNLPLSLLKVAS